MSNLPAPAVHMAPARMRALLQAFLKTLEADRYEGKRSRFSLMRALLFRIGMEIDGAAAVPASGSTDDVPGGSLAGERAVRGVLVEYRVLARNHLHDLEHALTALEVLGDPHRLTFQIQALLFIEWQLARLNSRDGQANRIEGRHACAGTDAPRVAVKGAVTRASSPDADAGTSGLDDLTYRGLLRDSIARAGSGVRLAVHSRSHRDRRVKAAVLDEHAGRSPEGRRLPLSAAPLQSSLGRCGAVSPSTGK